MFVANQRASCLFGTRTIRGAETYPKRWRGRRVAFELFFWILQRCGSVYRIFHWILTKFGIDFGFLVQQGLTKSHYIQQWWNVWFERWHIVRTCDGLQSCASRMTNSQIMVSMTTEVAIYNKIFKIVCILLAVSVIWCAKHRLFLCFDGNSK